MKKACLLIITIFVMLGSLQLASSAESLEGKMRLVADDEIKSNTFEVEVYLDENPGLISFRGELTYDMDVLELIKVQNTKLLKEWNPTNQNISPFVFGWIDAFNLDNNTNTGKIVVFKFRVKEGGQAQDTTIKLECPESNAADGMDFIDIVFPEASKTVRLTDEAFIWEFSVFDLDPTVSIICCVAAFLVIVALILVAVFVTKKRKRAKKSEAFVKGTKNNNKFAGKSASRSDNVAENTKKQDISKNEKSGSADEEK